MRTPFLVLALALVPTSDARAGERAIEFPDVEGALTLACDLHTHSVFSDGNVWPTIRVEEAERDGLDLLAVTEHLEYQPHSDDIPHPDRNRSFALASQHAARGRGEGGLIVVNGAEITKSMPPGHVNAIFLRDANPVRNDDPEAAYAAAAEQGAFVFWNHPAWAGQRKDGVAVLDDVHRSLVERGLLHGIEVANGDMVSEEALQMALEHGLTILGTSDVHGLIDWEADVQGAGHRTVTLVFARERSADAIHEALRAGRTVAWVRNTLVGRDEWMQPLLAASLTVQGARIRPDTRLVDVTLANASDATFVLASADAHRFYEHVGPIEVPAHGTLTLGVIGEPGASFDLAFDVLNARVAPDTVARITRTVVVR